MRGHCCRRIEYELNSRSNIDIFDEFFETLTTGMVPLNYSWPMFGEIDSALFSSVGKAAETNPKERLLLLTRRYL